MSLYHMDIAYFKQNATLSGRCDDDMRWYYLEGDLYIEGKGPLDLTKELVFDRFVPQEYSYEAQRSYPIRYPWEQVKDQIVRVHIAEGCTAIRQQTFDRHKNLREVSIPKGVKEIE